MIRLFPILFFTLGMAPTLKAQIWETITDQTIDTRSGNQDDHYSDFFRLSGFPDNLQDGDFIVLPGPDGKSLAVQVKNSPVLDPILQQRFPGIRAYSFHAGAIKGRMAVDTTGIDVVFQYKNNRYSLKHQEAQVYKLTNMRNAMMEVPDEYTNLGKCLTAMSMEDPQIIQNTSIDLRRAGTTKQRVYDLAISVTSTYSARHGGTNATVLAEINRVFNRVNEVFIREMSLRFRIVNESTQLFFHNKEVDPYIEGNNTLMLNTLDEQLVTTIGRSNYDLGHLLATNCGGGTAGVSAGVGTICEFNKGKALSCDLSNNLEEYVRVLTHELGHQLGAAHTWSNCPGINNTQRASASAYEPGSGSSIMSYINSCGNQNLTYIPGPFYFHTGSINQMLYYVEMGPGSTCVQTDEVDNINPDIISVNIPKDEKLYIPVGTPFVLAATATDSDGDHLTYAWDQLDIGPIAPLGEPIQSGPSIRSFAPDTTGTRYIPRMETLLANENDPEEVLPTYDRDLTFGLTVRDNNENGGGIAQEVVSFRSTTTAGPFFIDFPNDTTDQLFAGSLAKVQWNVAGTNTGLVNTPYVTITMSVDGGKTFPVVLAERADNDGEANVQIPNIVSDSVRFRIQGYNHIFYDVSDQNIPIVNPELPTFGLNISPGRQIICLPEEASVSIRSFPVLGFDETLHYSIRNPYPDVEITLSDTVSRVEEAIQIDFKVPESLDSDTLNFQFQAVGTTTDTIVRDISLIVVNNSHDQLKLKFPQEDVSGVEVVPTFQWNPSPNADYYNLQVSTSASFDSPSLVLSEPFITADSFPSSSVLEEGQVYFWRVLPQNQCAAGMYAPVSAFRTKSQECRQYTASDLPQGLGASAPGEIVSTIPVNDDFEISDVNIIDLMGFHESVNQLRLILEKDATQVVLYGGECGIRSLNVYIDFDDQSLDYTDCRLGSSNRNKPLEPLAAFNGKESIGDWKMHWQDSVVGAGGVFMTWTLELCGTVEAETLQVVTDTLFVAPGKQNPLTIDQIQVSGGSDFIYEWVDTTMSGQLLRNGTPLRPGQKWSQEELASGMIQYKNEADFEVEAILVSVEDPDGGWSGIVRVPVALDATVPVSRPDLKPSVEIFPNPAVSYLTIRPGSETNIQMIRVQNLQGQELYRHHGVPGGTTRTISTTSWPAGLVLVTITTDSNQWTEKIVIH